MKNTFTTTSAYVENSSGDRLIYPFGPSILQTEIPDNLRQELLEEGQKLTKEQHDASSVLAGNFKKGRSLFYSDDYRKTVEPYFVSKALAYFDILEKQYQSTSVVPQVCKNLTLDSLWINFSEQFDFNPSHDHNGLISFVLYCDVPPEILKDQANTNTPLAGKIIFEYGEKITDFMYNTYTVQPYNNLMLLFPGKLRHQVPPFWANAVRVSISGNFSIRAS
jgi:hypothetical protein